MSSASFGVQEPAIIHAQDSGTAPWQPFFCKGGKCSGHERLSAGMKTDDSRNKAYKVKLNGHERNFSFFGSLRLYSSERSAVAPQYAEGPSHVRALSSISSKMLAWPHLS